MTYEEAVRGQFLRVAGIHVKDPNARHRLPRLALADNFFDDVVPNDVKFGLAKRRSRKIGSARKRFRRWTTVTLEARFDR